VRAAVAFPLWLEMNYTVPAWVHLVTTLPLVLLTCILPLRPLKGAKVFDRSPMFSQDGDEPVDTGIADQDGWLEQRGRAL
jgi:hypothetical protein